MTVVSLKAILKPSLSVIGCIEDNRIKAIIDLKTIDTGGMPYSGDYEIHSRYFEQTLPTENKKLIRDILVHKNETTTAETPQTQGVTFIIF